MKLYNVRTAYNEVGNYDSYNVLANSAEAAIVKIKPKLGKDESVEEITLVSTVDYK